MAFDLPWPVRRIRSMAAAQRMQVRQVVVAELEASGVAARRHVVRARDVVIRRVGQAAHGQVGGLELLERSSFT